MKALGWVAAILGVFVLGPIWAGWVFAILWGWFILPFFHLPQISIALAIGLSMVVRMLTSSGTSDNSGKSASETFISLLVYSFLYPLLVLVMGAIVHAFV